MSYRERLQKRITLPSGASIVIHALNTFSEPWIIPRRNGEEDAGIKLAKFCLTNPNNGPLEFEGEKLRIVDKPAGEGEIAISELSQADADFIVNQVIEFSGLGKAGQEARKTFPEGQEASGATASAGTVVSLPADRPAQAAVG